MRNSIQHNLSLNKAFHRTKDQSPKNGGGIWRIDPEHSNRIFKKLKLKNSVKRRPITTIHTAEPARKMIKIEASNDEDLTTNSDEIIKNEDEKDTESETKMGFQFHFLALQENSNDFEPEQLTINPSTVS